MKTKDLLQNFKTNNKLLFIALTTIILVVILYILGILLDTITIKS